VLTHSVYSRERASSSFAERVYASAQVRVSVNTRRKTSARVLAANTRSALAPVWNGPNSCDTPNCKCEGYFTLLQVLAGRTRLVASTFRIDASEFEAGNCLCVIFVAARIILSCVCRSCNLLSSTDLSQHLRFPDI